MHFPNLLCKRRIRSLFMVFLLPLIIYEARYLREFAFQVPDDTVHDERFETAPMLQPKPIFNQKISQEHIPDLGVLIKQMGDIEEWQWIKGRISQKWELWKEALLKERTKGYLEEFHRKNILVMPGVLSRTNFAKSKVIASGGPLGELLQWADLIAGLHILGHNVILERDIGAGSARLRGLIGNNSANAQTKSFDIIYLDYLAFGSINMEVQHAFRCRFRVLDVYGTQARHNNPQSSKVDGKHVKATGLKLHLKQYYTFYPQTPDNSFLGFVVSPPDRGNISQKENIGVIYGKDSNYIKGLTDYIDTLSKYMDVHYTMRKQLSLPTAGKLVRAGVLSSTDYGRLLDRAKVFIGLGDPIEGTGAMEALAHGCVFLNPKFTRQSQRRFIDHHKPTDRLVTSQIPYLEQFIGKPYVHTVDVKNLTEVNNTVFEIMHQQDFKPLIPEEFTVNGYLERLSSYIEHQNFCGGSNTWPPLSLLQVILSSDDESCEDACFNSGKICEPIFFPTVNSLVWFSELTVDCSSVRIGDDVIYPAVTVNNTTICWLQNSSLSFSCAIGSVGHRRLCPCRRFRKHQVALWH